MTRKIIAVSAVCFAAACGGSSATQPSMPVPSPMTATVNATPSLAFSPTRTTIAPGGTVTFAFGSVAHNIYFNSTQGAPTDIPGSNANTSVTRSFPAAGTYVYQCRIHAGMQGTIVVAATTTSSNGPASKY
jgi:plastocyanin